MEAGEHRYVQGRWLVLGAVQDSKGNNEVVITSWADVEFDFWGWRYVANTRKNYNWLREGKMQKTGRGCYGGRDGKYRTEATLRIENKESYEVSLNLDGKGGIDLKIPGNHVREIKARSGARTRSCWGS